MVEAPGVPAHMLEQQVRCTARDGTASAQGQQVEGTASAQAEVYLMFECRQFDKCLGDPPTEAVQAILPSWIVSFLMDGPWNPQIVSLHVVLVRSSRSLGCVVLAGA